MYNLWTKNRWAVQIQKTKHHNKYSVCTTLKNKCSDKNNFDCYKLKSMRLHTKKCIYFSRILLFVRLFTGNLLSGKIGSVFCLPDYYCPEPFILRPLRERNWVAIKTRIFSNTKLISIVQAMNGNLTTKSWRSLS